MPFRYPRWPADVYLATGAKAVSACGDFLAATALVNAAAVSGYLLGGLLLAVIPVRTCIASAGLSALSLTAIFAVPLLRAAGLSRSGRPAQA
jgi:hypothetical protein